MRSAIRPRSPSPPSRPCARRSRTSTRRGHAGAWTRSCWTTCSWTPPSSGCIPARRPSRCAAWGITTEGKPAFIGLAPGTGESFDAWHGFLVDLKDRGLASPLLVISDGAAGLIGAIEQAFPTALRQRCIIIHRARNVLAKVPAGMQAEVKDAYWAIFGTEDLKTGPGPGLAEIIDARISEFAARYQALYPAAARCLLADREGLTAYLRFPRGHHHRTRHSNFIERTFGETRRRVKVIGRLPGETSCLTLVWAVLDRASAGWRGLTMTPAGLRLLQDLRRSLLEPPARLRPRTGPAAPAAGDLGRAATGSSDAAA
jgi:putative transposase